MEDNRYDFTPEEDNFEEINISEENKKSIRGYRVVIILLAVILAGVSWLYYSLNRQQQRDYEFLKVDRDSIQSNLSHLINDFDSLKFTNDTIAANLAKANEVMEQLKRERRWNYAKIKEYEKEVGTLRAVMKNYLRQIDSLNTLNKQLISENISYRKEISTANLRAEVAEEKATELQNKVQMGAVIRARDISIVPLNKRGNEVSRIKQAVTLRTDFGIAGNELASAGVRTVYLRITSPDGYLLTTDDIPSFTAGDETISYTASREIDYQNEDVAVSIYYNGTSFGAGDYKVELYIDGYLAGTSIINLR